MSNVFISCPPMIGEKEQVLALADSLNLDVTLANVVQTLSEDELCNQLPHYDAWIAGDDPGTRRVLMEGYNGQLRTVVKWGIGVDNIDRAAIEELGLNFSNTPGMFNDEVADIALGYLLALVRQIPFVDRQVRQGNWIKPQGQSLAGKTAAVVGLGNIGQALVKRLLACDLQIIGYDPYVAELADVENCAWPNNIERADYVFLCCALNEQNHHLINADLLSRLKNSTSIINVSRGPLIDEPSLCHALQSGQLAGAALDVFEQEPLPTTSPLAAMDQVILGSHNASNTKEAVRATNERAMLLVQQYLNE